MPPRIASQGLKGLQLAYRLVPTHRRDLCMSPKFSLRTDTEMKRYFEFKVHVYLLLFYSILMYNS